MAYVSSVGMLNSIAPSVAAASDKGGTDPGALS